jgi:nucleoside phosphorylase
MPLEMKAVVKAFGVSRTSDGEDARWTGRVGNTEVTAIHIGMGPTLTRLATARLFDETAADYKPVDHVMVAGICGGLDPALEIGTLINPEIVIEYKTGTTYRHSPPGDAPQAGKLITTEGVMLDSQLSQRFLEDGCLGVDMESSAVAEVCEAQGCPWSVYRCISDRIFDGLLDQRIVALGNPDGSGNASEIEALIAAEPELAMRLERLGHDAALAAGLAAAAAFRGCVALNA